MNQLMSDAVNTTANTELDTVKRGFHRIDHIAIAVRDLEEAIRLFSEVLGFQLVRRFEARGKSTGMILAEMEHGEIKFVLCQGTEPESPISQLISQNGPGIHHVALHVADPARTVEELGARGLEFDSPVIEGPGLVQVFSTRDENSGLAFEFINRNSESGFLEQNISQLFEGLETNGKF